MHVLLNRLEIHKKDMGGKIILEGESVKLVDLMSKPDHFLYQLYLKAQEQNLIIGACKAVLTSPAVLKPLSVKISRSSVKQQDIHPWLTSSAGDIPYSHSNERYLEDR